MSMVNSSKKENDRFFNLSRKVNGTHFLRVDGLKGLMFHFGTLVLSNCCKFCDCWGERDKPGVAGRRLSPAVGVRGRRREIPVILSGLRPSRMTAGMTFGWSQGDPSPSIFKNRPKCVKTAVCHILTFVVCIFVRARFYADDIPYSIGDCGVFDVL